VVATSPSVSPAAESREPWLDRLPVGSLAALETLLLGAIAAFLAFYVFPRAFGIESWCVGPTGQQTTAGDTYVGAFAVLGTLGWLGVFLGIVYASIAERRGVVLLLPLLWFLALTLPALGVAVILGPEPCPS
jgi:hypothetical protein